MLCPWRVCTSRADPHPVGIGAAHAGITTDRDLPNALHDRPVLVVDVQKDFGSGCALLVPDCDRVVTSLAQYVDDVVALGLTSYASRDWHPAVTNHVREYGGSSPIHWVQGTDCAV